MRQALIEAALSVAIVVGLLIGIREEVRLLESVISLFIALVSLTVLVSMRMAANRRELGPQHCALHGLPFGEDGCPGCRATQEPPR